ncbi:MAG: carboxymethylenebutenolidase [Alphaproteobacteria bacterium]|jgi:carboxymethylenebutenolidase|nr:carboxymethylenebutenolidase [Alphaproteobacteria bacterium]
MPTMVSVSVNGSAMDIYVDAPAGSTPVPAIVLMYHRDGLDDFTRRVAAKLAAGGYLVAVPDVSHRCPADVPMKDRKPFFKDSEVVADIRATVEVLRARNDVDKDRLVIMGHCMGGRMTLLGVGRVADFRAAVVYYGGGVHASWGGEDRTPFDTLAEIRCPVIGFFGKLDKNPSPEQVDKIDAELTRHGVTHTFHRYEDAGHGFQNREPGTRGEREAAEDSWTKTFAFLQQVLSFQEAN